MRAERFSASAKLAIFADPHSSLMLSVKSSAKDVVDTPVDDVVIETKIAARCFDLQKYKGKFF